MSDGDSIPELRPAKPKRPLPIAIALSFFLVPAGAFLWVHRDSWLPSSDSRASAPPVVHHEEPPPPHVEPPPRVAEPVRPPGPVEKKPAETVPDVADIKEVDRLLQEGEQALRDGRGKPNSVEATRAALSSFEKARDLLRGYLEKHPDRERFVANRMKQTNSQIAWCRKTLPIDIGNKR